MVRAVAAPYQPASDLRRSRCRKLTPRRPGWSGVKRGAQLAGSGVKRGAKLVGLGVRRDVQCGGARRRSKSRYSRKTKASPKGSPEGGPVLPLRKDEPMGGLTTYDIGALVTQAALHCSLCPADADCNGGTFRPLPRVGYGQNKAPYALNIRGPEIRTRVLSRGAYEHG
jgi:hypothetical protein